MPSIVHAGLMPDIRKDEYGISYVTTKAGNRVAVAEDPSGRTFFIDQAGTLYYDTGDTSIGAYVVSKPCLMASQPCLALLAQ